MDLLSAVLKGVKLEWKIYEQQDLMVNACNARPVTHRAWPLTPFPSTNLDLLRPSAYPLGGPTRTLRGESMELDHSKPTTSSFQDRRKAIRREADGLSIRRTEGLEVLLTAVMFELRTPLTAARAFVESLEVWRP